MRFFEFLGVWGWWFFFYLVEVFGISRCVKLVCVGMFFRIILLLTKIEDFVRLMCIKI